jgi:hypothetical protein
MTIFYGTYLLYLRIKTNASERQRTPANASERQRTPANVSERQRTSAKDSEHQRNGSRATQWQLIASLLMVISPFAVVVRHSLSFVVVRCRSFPRSPDPQLLVHSYQVRQRAGPHLVHHLTALNFDRDLTGTQFCSDLFVEEPRDHFFHHLPLARRQ